MAKPTELVRLALVIMSIAFLLQIPIFFLLFKFSSLAQCSSLVLSLDSSSVLFSKVNGTDSEMSKRWHTARGASKNVLAPGREDGNKLSSADLEGVHPQTATIPSFKALSYPHYPYVHFNTYRESLQTIYVVGITSVVARKYDRPVYKCEWHPRNGTSEISPYTNAEEFNVTEAAMIYVEFDENGKTYVPAIVNCTFSEPVGADDQGGLLRLWVSTGPNREKRTETLDVWIEQPGELEKIRTEEPKYEYAFCGPPMHTRIRSEWVHKWLVYHHYFWDGKAHFYFYNVGGLDDEGRKLLDPFVQAGLLTITDAIDQKEYPSWYYNQLLFINDCLHKTRFASRWTFYHDLDEFLWIPPPNTLKSLLEENRDVPWMTFGNLPHSMGHCKLQESPSDWHLERMLWHNKKPECMHSDKDPWACFEAPGRRKYVVNPRKVFSTGVHRTSIPGTGGINCNASIARVHHYHGVLNPNVNICGTQVNLSLPLEHLMWAVPGFSNYDRDDTMALEIGKAKLFAGSLLSNQQNSENS